MDAIKALNKSTGQAIQDILMPTLEITIPLLLKNKEAILSIQRKEETYGRHPRQKLDIYLPVENPVKSPILIFFYGGGLIRGDKIVPTVPEQLLYHNVGSFFAQRGIATIIADYRRVNSPFGGEDAVYPSGGDDVSLVLKWLGGFEHKGSGNVVIMGNSAGGIHISTFLLAPQYLEQRQNLAAGEKGIKLVGAVGLGVPFHFKSAEAGRANALETYYGDATGIKEKCPYGLLKAIENAGKPRGEVGVPNMLLLLGEFDPEDEIGQPNHDFAELCEKIWSTGTELKIIEGHNHISPPPFLMTGQADGEKWAEDVAEWIKRLNN
ncbi:Isoprenylcysteine methylesterase 2 [Hyphodiscus hymeniophilus]|uniref:Isoprenylcysteine methylesterase 2 n=1 Tax=Hyphodiscus hymeniophilus TaxID=353542 RepID=A0A9P6SQQ0_9HELO|nr:Isoprenylcysteine methylesterase 2 [Hyphodiscus hymeniophilus]